MSSHCSRRSASVRWSVPPPAGAAVERIAYSTGSVRTPWRRSVPAVLPDCSGSLAMSITSSDSCQATPICSQAAAIRAATWPGAPENSAPNSPEVAMSEPVFSVMTCM